MMFFVLLTVLELLSYSSAADVYGVVGDDVTFTWNFRQEPVLVILTRSDRLEMGQWFGGQFIPENPYKDRLKFSYMDQGTARLILKSSIETDYNKTYYCEKHYFNGSYIMEENILHKQHDISPGNGVEITQWCLFLPGLLYIMLGNKGVTHVMVLSLLFLLSTASTVMADEITDDNCNVTQRNPITTTNNGTLSMKWEFFKLKGVTEVQFRRHNKTTSESMVTLTPVNSSFTFDNRRIQFNFFIALLSKNLNAVEIISNMTPRDTEYDYDILVKLESGCEIKGSLIRPRLPWRKVTPDHSEVYGPLGNNISMVWTYESDQNPQNILFKKLNLQSGEHKNIGELIGEEIHNVGRHQVLRHQKSRKGGRVHGIVTLTLLNTTQLDYGAWYRLEMVFDGSHFLSPYINAKLSQVINRSAIVSSQSLDIKLIIIMCSMLSLIIGWKS